MLLVMRILSANNPIGQFDPVAFLYVPLAVYALGNGITSWRMAMLTTSRRCLRMLFLFGLRGGASDRSRAAVHSRNGEGTDGTA